MKILDLLSSWLGRATYGGSAESVTVEIPANIYYLEMALYTATTLISNAVGRCEFETYESGKKVMKQDYFMLNVSPNKNQTSSQFWHKIIEKMVYEDTAFVFETGGSLFCADSWGLQLESPLYGNTYTGVSVDGYQFSRTFSSRDVCVFKLENKSLKNIMNMLYSEYGKMLAQAAQAFRRTNGRKYKLKIEGYKPGDEDFDTYFKNVVSKQLKDYMEKSDSIYPEFEGYELIPEDGQSIESTDYLKLRKDLFEMVGSALKIPTTLMSGDGKNTAAITTFLTLCVDPIADMLAEGLNKRAGYNNWVKGNRYKANTGSIYHINVFDLATDIDKLISSGFANIDEVRTAVGWDEIGTDWSRRHWMTKNYDDIENTSKGIAGKGENKDGKDEDDVSV